MSYDRSRDPQVQEDGPEPFDPIREEACRIVNARHGVNVRDLLRGDKGLHTALLRTMLHEYDVEEARLRAQL